MRPYCRYRCCSMYVEAVIIHDDVSLQEGDAPATSGNSDFSTGW
jgi:hypothetical protein